MTIWAAALLCGNLALICTGLISVQRKKTSGALYILALSIIIVCWSFPYLLSELKWIDVDSTTISEYLIFFWSIAASVLLIFSLVYTNRSRWLTRLTIILLMIQPICTIVFYWARPLCEVLFKDSYFWLHNTLPLPELWENITSIYIFNFEIASSLLLLDNFIRKPKRFISPSGILLTSSIIPLFVHLISMIWLNPDIHHYLNLIGYSILTFGLAQGLYSIRSVEATPVTREVVVEGMNDGWMVVDSKDKIIDLNPAIEKITKLSREQLYGKPISDILSEWSNLIGPSEGIREYEIRKSFRRNDNWSYLNIRISQLKDQNQLFIGYLIIWQDITNKKMSMLARQKAREEMFVLLNGISSAASNTVSLNDFLAESIRQIVFAFQCQAIGIFLSDQNNKKDEDRVQLIAHYGLSDHAAAKMRNLPKSLMFSWVSETKQPLIIDNMDNNPQLPEQMWGMDYSHLILLPLIIHTEPVSKILGYLTLAKNDHRNFTPDEIIRISIISEHIATLIESNQRRQSTIAFTERQRLFRDLHDSVSQKLYGLVTMTEAAQAAIEAGSKVSIQQVLVRMGDNARQAVKEMRLFLYEMQPVDLEEDGLVSVLHHRLAAVEGRADIKARLVADDDLSLPKEKEVALYFIAQEALNNILRHAHAKSVSIILKKKRKNFMLEILDDGIGFIPEQIAPGGMGLKNMKERVSLIDGKIKIVSNPGDGTKITVTVPRTQVFP